MTFRNIFAKQKHVSSLCFRKLKKNLHLFYD